MGKLHRQLLDNIKRGFASLFVCSIVFLPVFFVARWPQEVKTTTTQASDTRNVTALPPLATRPADLAGAPKLFQEPVISITFDDGWLSIYTEAAPLLTRYGIRSTQYVMGGVYDNTAYMTMQQVKHMQANGQEIACHTMTHRDITSLSEDTLLHELHDCQTVLAKNHGPIREFASPYGRNDGRTMPIIKQYYRSHRNTNGDISNGVDHQDVNTAAQFDMHNIIGVTIRSDTTVDQLKAAVAYAKANNGWLVLTYHQADDSTDSVFAVDRNKLQEQLAYLASTDVKIAPVGQALDSYNGNRR